MNSFLPTVRLILYIGNSVIRFLHQSILVIVSYLSNPKLTIQYSSLLIGSITTVHDTSINSNNTVPIRYQTGGAREMIDSVPPPLLGS